MIRPVCLLPLCLLAACSLDIRDRVERRWVGPLAAADASERCPPTRALLSVRDDRVTFVPDQGTWVLTGTASGTAINAARSRPTPDHKSYDTVLVATASGGAVIGTYTTPFCKYRVDLHEF